VANSLTKKGIYWVTRIRGNAKYEVVDDREFVINGNVLSDQVIQYTSMQRRKEKLLPIRLIKYRDYETEKDYEFITNNFSWSAQTIADIYKQRWQVELFFKWIKQNLKIKSFLGNSKNAVLTQVLSALCVYLLVSFLKFQSKIPQNMQEICRLLHSNLFAKRTLRELFDRRKPKLDISPQLRLSLVRI
jgi:IS4 transposase